MEQVTQNVATLLQLLTDSFPLILRFIFHHIYVWASNVQIASATAFGCMLVKEWFWWSVDKRKIISHCKQYKWWWNELQPRAHLINTQPNNTNKKPTSNTRNPKQSLEWYETVIVDAKRAHLLLLMTIADNSSWIIHASLSLSVFVHVHRLRVNAGSSFMQMISYICISPNLKWTNSNINSVECEQQQQQHQQPNTNSNLVVNVVNDRILFFSLCLSLASFTFWWLHFQCQGESISVSFDFVLIDCMI